MEFLAILLGSVLGVIIIVGIIAYVIYKKFTNFTRSIGISNSELKNMIQENKKITRNSYFFLAIFPRFVIMNLGSRWML